MKREIMDFCFITRRIKILLTPPSVRGDLIRAKFCGGWNADGRRGIYCTKRSVRSGI